MRRFILGAQVWRVQGDVKSKDGTYAYGPATVTAVINRKSRTTYLLTWNNGPEVTDEQDPKHLFPSHHEAVAEADRQFNAHLDTQRRG